MNRLLATTASLAMVAVALAAAPNAAAEKTAPKGSSGEPTVVASGLNNPRQLAFSPKGALYVAEAGAGGSGPCIAGPEGGEACFGKSGSITKVWKGGQARVVTGLPSLAGEDGSASGPSDLVFTGKRKVVVAIGLGANPEARASLGRQGRSMGTLRAIWLPKGWGHTVADLAKFELKANPIHDPDSNPTGVARTRHGLVATDAGGNTLVGVSWRGKVKALAVFEDQLADDPFGGPDPIPSQAVPTDVVRGPDGALYVSQLTGFPFQPGLANIYRVKPGHAPTVYASGLTNVTSLAFDKRGTLYAVQIADGGLLAGPFGSVVRVAPDWSGKSHETVIGDLFAPYGIAIRGHSAYVTTGSVAPGAGEVLRVPLH